ncbi:hypothetical protein ABSL23_13195 [Halobacterium sp. NMX12-1]|uniref:Uncharacterized protein n=1 Tax=Halobacterium sp. NMX12-1 TaxID=3166650 RepID=A0AAU8CB59_9EURY
MSENEGSSVDSKQRDGSKNPTLDDLDPEKILESIQGEDGEDTEEIDYHLSLGQKYFHSMGIYGDEQPSYDDKIGMAEVVAGDQNAFHLDVTNDGDQFFPGGEIKIDKVRYQSNTLSHASAWEIPELSVGESEVIKNIIPVVEPGMVAFNTTVVADDGGKVSVNGENSEYFFVSRGVAREDLILIENVEEISNKLE